MPANYASAKILLKNGRLTTNAFFYSTASPASQSNLPVYTSNGVKYVAFNTSVGNWSIQPFNNDSALWVVFNGELRGEFATVWNTPLTSWTKCIELHNGNYYAARRSPADSQTIALCAFRADGTPLTPEAGVRSINPNMASYICVTLFDDGTTIFPSLMYMLPDFNNFTIEGTGTNIANFNWATDNVINSNDPYYFADESGPDGGFGDFDYSGDIVEIPDLPTISVADSGFVRLYKPSLTQLQNLAAYMWTGAFDINNFKKIFADPMDCIISLNIVPISLPVGTAQELKVGNIGTGIMVDSLDAQFLKIKYAARNIGVRTNSFMDFSPYVKCQIFLPFIGVRSLSIDDIANADVTIEYHIDVFSGACTAYIKCEKNNSDNSELNAVLYEFSGNVCANVPFTATNYSNFLGSILQTAGAITTAIATQGSSSAVAGALSSGIDTATAIKPDIERSGNMASTNGFLGIQRPYLIVTYPHLCKPATRDKTVGTPSFIGLTTNKKLNSFHGFTKLHKINVKGIPCTEEERKLIENQLTEGVILI